MTTEHNDRSQTHDIIHNYVSSNMNILKKIFGIKEKEIIENKIDLNTKNSISGPKYGTNPMSCALAKARLAT